MDILAINTDLMERSVIQQVLERGGNKVVFAHNTEDAWQLILNQGIRFVIADTTPDPQVIHQFIQRVRSAQDLHGHVYILLLTPKGQDGKLLASLGKGADDYLNKPIVPQELKARVTVGVRILNMGNDLTQARDQLDNLAIYDPLTGLINRQAFYKQAQGELERARRSAQGVSVIVLDIDNFRAINTQHGHIIGDEVLQIVAQIIREKSRPYDCIGRWAGDQFSIALPGVISTDAEKIALRILNGVQSSEISLEDGTALNVNLSAGIASAQNINAYAEIDTFIQSAVQALHASQQDEGERIGVVFI